MVDIDPATDTVTATFRSTVANPFVITGGHGQLWAADFLGTEAVRIDLAAVPDNGRESPGQRSR